MSDPGHVDTWGAPRDGWPEFCDCGKRKQDGRCPECDETAERLYEASRQRAHERAERVRRLRK